MESGSRRTSSDDKTTVGQRNDTPHLDFCGGFFGGARFVLDSVTAGPAAGCPFGRRGPPRRARDLRSRIEISRANAKGGRELAGQRPVGARHGRNGADGVSGVGEDPNFGLYSVQVRRALRNIISAQDAATGYVGQSMYHHGFAMLALAESYGAVDDRNLWPDRKNQRTIGQALELAVRTAITSQKQNPLGGWRYSPEARDADTSVSGAVMVGLLAARNAGIEVPDEAMDRAVSYYQGMTSQSGQVAYSGGMGGFDNSTARVAIATLVYSIARRRDLPEYKATLGFLKDRLENSGYDGRGYVDYTRYYQVQALFQGDVDSWEKWNKMLVRQLKQSQQADGSIRGNSVCRSARPCRCSHWPSITVFCRSTNADFGHRG